MQVTYFKSAVVHIGALYYVIKVSMDGTGEMEQQSAVLAAYARVQEFRFPHGSVAGTLAPNGAKNGNRRISGLLTFPCSQRNFD